ncbi:MAG: phosphotransferase family protein [Anaerolineales bacterium]|nr:phosphotransferase family protein [Anaerolineales bacterium]
MRQNEQDTMPMRPDERLDEARLAAYLRGRLPGSDEPLAVRQFGGGKANLTYLLDYGARQYVLRRPPLGPVAPSAHDMEREYRVLSVLHQAFPLAPRAFLFCDDVAVAGAPFFVMERCEGVVVRTQMPAIYAARTDAARRMSETLVDVLVALQAVDYGALGLAGLGRPDGFVARQVDGWYRRWQRAKVAETPAMESVYTWLRTHIPPSPAPTLVHNDFKLDNVMLAADDPGRAVAVFDWDMCTLGDPLCDLGALLAYWTEPDDPPYLRMVAASIMPPGEAGFLRRAELVRRYAAVSGRDVSHIRFYHALGVFRVAVILAQIYVRFVRGQTQDSRFAGMGQLIPLLAEAAEMICDGRL